MTEDLQISMIQEIIESRMQKGKNSILQFNISDVKSIISDCSKVLEGEEILLRLYGDFIIVGDLHGNIDDLLRIFTKFGYPPEKKYIFLGDYVDRGDYSLEVIVFLMTLKIRYSDYVFLLRGNHESESMTTSYGFREECVFRLEKSVYSLFLNLFGLLPIAAVVNSRIFCVHGGISKNMQDIETLALIRKSKVIPMKGILCDLLWSDPSIEVDNFVQSDRGVGFIFGANPLLKFLDKNNLDLLIRSHESCAKGFDYPFNVHKNASKKCITVFSATDYCGEHNKGAVFTTNKENNDEVIVLGSDYKKLFILPSWIMSEEPLKVPVEKMLPLDNSILMELAA